MPERKTFYEPDDIDRNPFVEEDDLSRSNSEDMVSSGGCPNTRIIVSPEEFANFSNTNTIQAKTENN